MILNIKKQPRQKLILKSKKLMAVFIWGSISITSTNLFAETTHDCSIVDDTAETLMQIRQSGFDLGDAEINEAELNPAQISILRGMIEDIKKMPIYQLQPTKDKAFKDLTTKWNKICLEQGDTQKKNRIG